MEKINKSIMALAMMVALTGCMKMNMTVDVNKDGKVATSVQILASKDLLTAAKTDEATYLSQLTSQLKSNNDDVVIEEIRDTINDVDYVGIKATNAYSSSLSTTVNEGTITLTLPIDQMSQIFKDSGITEESLKQYGLTTSQLKTAGVEMNIVVNMPSAATSTVGTVSGKTVTIDLIDDVLNSDTEVTTAVITAKEPSPMNPAVIGIIALVVIAVIFFVFKKKNKRL